MQPRGQKDEVVYDLVELHELPLVDVGRSLKKVLLSDRYLRAYVRINKKLKRASLLLYFAAFPIGAAVMTVAAKNARLMAPFKFSLQIPFLMSVSAGLRADILWCLATTYDFWFFTVTNALTAAFFTVHFSDQRIFLVPVYWWGIQLCVCADAKVNDPHVAGGAALAALYHVFLLVVFGLHFAPAAHPIVLFDNNGYSMTSNDVLLNSFSTMMVLMARTSYRQRIYFRARYRQLTTTRMSSYPCRVKLSEVRSQPETHHQQEDGAQHQPDPTTAASPSTLQRLRFVKPKQTFRAHEVVCPPLFDFVTRRSTWRIDVAVRVLGTAGFGLNVTAFAGSHAWSKATLTSASFLALSLASLLYTIGFCAILVGLYQRQLLHRLVSSFDFVFITAQNTLAYVAVCDMYSWDPRCIPIVTGWVWLV